MKFLLGFKEARMWMRLFGGFMRRENKISNRRMAAHAKNQRCTHACFTW
jgi:hypothetical protein